MKITSTIRNLYNDEKPQYELLKNAIDSILISIIQENGWSYESRIKELVSFALKIEAGKDPFEDFFGCKIIVVKKSEIDDVINLLIKNNFEIVDQRPKDVKQTQINPNEFTYNDLRLHVKYRQAEHLQPKEYFNKVFEIQIATLFGHVWSKATHDLIYKGNDISWAKSRIAYQIKAILEQAQYAIDTIEMTQEDYYPKHDEYTIKKKLISFLNEHWVDRLPNDLNRLTDIILNFLKKANSTFDELQEIISAENIKNRGAKLLNISPYQSIIKSYANQKPACFETLKKGDFRIVITEEIDLDTSLIERLKSQDRIKDLRVVIKKK